MGSPLPGWARLIPRAIKAGPRQAHGHLSDTSRKEKRLPHPIPHATPPFPSPRHHFVGRDPFQLLLRSPMSDPAGEQVCGFFRKSTKNKQIRKRPSAGHSDSDEDESSSQPAPTKPKRSSNPDNKLHFSSSTTSSKPSAADAAGNESKMFHFESSTNIQVEHDSRATATLETETAFDRDARAIRERVLKRADEALKGKGPKGKQSDENVYKGIHGYTDYKAGFRREQTVAGEKAGGAHGPLRASAHIRASTRFDYQPDICKDYKETGYCGFGDSCKFMHDRGDYKSGWQLEREWNEAEKERKRRIAMGGGDDDDDDAAGGDEDDEDDSLPFACFMCREPFEDPVVTKCKHYFCEHCALKV